MASPVERTDRDSIAILTLSHGKASAFDVELCAAIEEVLRGVEASPAKAVVITGRGGIFSAGVDLFRVVDGSTDDVERFLVALINVFTRVFTFPRPVIAAVNGHAIAGGCILACACDYRFMASGPGTIGVPELRVGVPFPAVALEILRSTVAPQFLQDLVYTGRVCSPDEARRVGLVDDVVSSETLLERAHAMASALAALPEQSFAATKEMLRHAALERVKSVNQANGNRVIDVWNLPATRAAIREYMGRTMAKSKAGGTSQTQ